jgi:hypothetical protein
MTAPKAARIARADGLSIAPVAAASPTRNESRASSEQIADSAADAPIAAKKTRIPSR